MYIDICFTSHMRLDARTHLRTSSVPYLRSPIIYETSSANEFAGVSLHQIQVVLPLAAESALVRVDAFTAVCPAQDSRRQVGCPATRRIPRCVAFL